MSKDLYFKALSKDRVCLVEFELEERPKERGKLIEEMQMDDSLKHTTKVGTSMTIELKEKEIAFLCTNQDDFAWSLIDMPGF